MKHGILKHIYKLICQNWVPAISIKPILCLKGELGYILTTYTSSSVTYSMKEV